VIAMVQRPSTNEGRTATLLFSRPFITIIRVAEQTGSLDTMLGDWSTQLGRDTHWRTTEWMRMLEPAVMILCGAWVAILVLSLYLPIIELGNVV
jgi:type II secretory pathway component PulF